MKSENLNISATSHRTSDGYILYELIASRMRNKTMFFHNVSISLMVSPVYLAIKSAGIPSAFIFIALLRLA